MNIFDILGSVMTSPPGSRITGAARIGKITLALLGVPAIKADIFLYGFFAKTYEDHGTDKTLIAGIIDMTTDNSRIRMAPGLARKQGLEIVIATDDINGAHPSIAKMTLADTSGKTISLLGSNIGGGNTLVKEVNRMGVSVIGQYTTLIIPHRDTPDTIAAVTEVVADTGVNIYNFRLSRQRKSEGTVMAIEIDGSFEPELNERTKTPPNIFPNTMLRPI